MLNKEIELSNDILRAYQDIKIPDDVMPSIASPCIDFDGVRDYDSAEWQYEKICEQMKDFQDNLDDEHEIALKLTNFGQSITMSVTDIGYQNPCLIYYYGYVNDKYCQLIQHVSQINFLLMSVPKPDPSKPARRVVIGFRDPEER